MGARDLDKFLDSHHRLRALLDGPEQQTADFHATPPKRGESSHDCHADLIDNFTMQVNGNSLVVGSPDKVPGVRRIVRRLSRWSEAH